MLNPLRYAVNKLYSNASLTLYRNYAFKSDLNIKWVRPTKTPCWKPENSGDNEPAHEIPKSTILLEFQKCKELET